MWHLGTIPIKQIRGKAENMKTCECTTACLWQTQSEAPCCLLAGGAEELEHTPFSAGYLYACPE